MAEREDRAVGSLFGLDEITLRRGRVVVDLFWVGLVAFFCIYSLTIPFFGIIVGAVLMNIGVSPASKKVGRACLILGIVSVVLVFLFLALSVFVGTFFQGLGGL